MATRPSDTDESIQHRSQYCSSSPTSWNPLSAVTLRRHSYLQCSRLTSSPSWFAASFLVSDTEGARSPPGCDDGLDPNLFSATRVVRPGPNMARRDEPDPSADPDRPNAARPGLCRGSPEIIISTSRAQINRLICRVGTPEPHPSRTRHQHHGFGRSQQGEGLHGRIGDCESIHRPRPAPRGSRRHTLRAGLRRGGGG